MTTFRKRIIKTSCVVFIPFFIRGETASTSQWLLMMVNQRETPIRVYLIDSFDCFFSHQKIDKIIEYIVRSFKSDEGEKEVVVYDVKITQQRTGWECGYRVIRMVGLPMDSDF